jgi:monovalent cation:H+ antiporter, CPA1 family
VRADGIEAWHAVTLRIALGGRRFTTALWLHRRLGWCKPLERALELRFERLLILRRVLRELSAYASQSLRPLFGDGPAATLDGLLSERIQATECALGALEIQFPEYAAELAVEHVQRAALLMEAADYRASLEEQLISPEVHDHLQRSIEERRNLVRRRPPIDLGLRLGDLMSRAPLFATLSSDKTRRIGRLLKPRLVTPGEQVIAKGARADGMYFIASGALEVHVGGEVIPLASGDFFGEMGLIDRRTRNADVYAKGYSHLLYLEAAAFDELLESDAEIRERIVAAAEARRAALETDDTPQPAAVSGG